MSRSVRASLGLVLLLLCTSAGAQPEPRTGASRTFDEGTMGQPAAESRGSESDQPPELAQATRILAATSATMGEEIEVVGHYLHDVGTSDSASTPIA